MSERPRYEKEFYLQLIEEVRRHPEIYNLRKFPKKKHIRAGLWNEISSNLCKPVDMCKKRWIHLRDTFRKCMAEEANAEGSSTWQFFEQMKFLSPFLKDCDKFGKRKAKERVETEEEDEQPQSDREPDIVSTSSKKCKVEEEEESKRLCGKIFISNWSCFSFSCTDCEEELGSIDLFLEHVKCVHLATDEVREVDPLQMASNEISVPKNEPTSDSEDFKRNEQELPIKFEKDKSTNRIDCVPKYEPTSGSEDFERDEHELPVEFKKEVDGSTNENAVHECQETAVVNNLENCFQCPICERKFDTQLKLDNHKRRHSEKIGNYRCDYCGKMFKTQVTRNRHMKLHSSDRKQHVCELCGESFLTILGYNIHKTRHTNSGRFKCDTCCSKSFATKVQLQRHQGIRQFECEICKKRYCNQSELRVHMRSHTGEKPYVCEVCGKGYSVSGHLNSHMKGHLNLKEHKCSVCGTGFNKVEHMKAHMLIHGEKTFSCHVCGKKFAKSYSLTRHMKMHAKQEA